MGINILDLLTGRYIQQLGSPYLKKEADIPR